MASVKINYTVQSCPKCDKKLLKVMTGTVLVGSPLITCKKCGDTYRTDLRVEWYKYPNKMTLFLVPLLIPVGLLLTGTIMEDLVIGIMAAILGIFISLSLVIPELIRVFRSKKRMKDKAYLQRLLLAKEISMDEYEEFTANLK